MLISISKQSGESMQSGMSNISSSRLRVYQTGFLNPPASIGNVSASDMKTIKCEI